MTPEQQSLWRKLYDYEIGPPQARLPFAKRLARENRWSLKFAERVVAEYKRFLFLCVRAGHPVTPSDQVDQAWHLHLVYTQDYWQRLCDEILGRPLHHTPTEGGEAESQKFDVWYNKTLESYTRLFGINPPEDIWPPSAVRFGRDLHFYRVNLQNSFLLKKPSALSVALPLFFILSGALVGCNAFPNVDSKTFLTYYIGFSVLCGLWCVSGLKVSSLNKERRTVPDVLRPWPLLVMIAVGILRFIQGLSTEHPVGILTLCIMGNVFGYVYCCGIGGSGSGDGGCSGLGSGCGSSGCSGGGCGGCGGD